MPWGHCVHIEIGLSTTLKALNTYDDRAACMGGFFVGFCLVREYQQTLAHC